jgi:hypothetical protein
MHLAICIVVRYFSSKESRTGCDSIPAWLHLVKLGGSRRQDGSGWWHLSRDAGCVISGITSRTVVGSFMADRKLSLCDG